MSRPLNTSKAEGDLVLLQTFRLRKQPTFCDVTTVFPQKWRLSKDRRNSILMTCRYPVLIGRVGREICFYQKHKPDLDSDTSSVSRNFCSRCSDVISPGNQWWRHEMSAVISGEFKQPRRRPHRRLQKNNRFNDQNNSSARASRFLVHFFDVYCTTTTWNLLIWRFMEDVDILRRISLHLFEPV